MDSKNMREELLDASGDAGRAVGLGHSAVLEFRATRVPAIDLATCEAITMARIRQTLRMLAACWLCLISSPGNAVAGGTTYLCNGSSTMPIYVAMAWRTGYTSNYRSEGWYKLDPSGNLLSSPCVRLGVTGFTAPVYLAVAHDDPSGRRSLYEYSIEDHWFGRIARDTYQWICVSLAGPFTLNANGVEGLATCPKGMRSIPFDIEVRPPDIYGDDSDTILTVAEPGNKGAFVATFEELNQGYVVSVAKQPDKGTWSVSSNHVTYRYSDAEALKNCESLAKLPGCVIIARTRGKCLALASSGTTKQVSVAIKDTKEDAMNTAMAMCNKTHRSCIAGYDTCTR